MAQGAQSKALIIVSKMQGWDPTQIVGGESIANFDAPNGIDNRAGTGKLPQGIPDVFPDSAYQSGVTSKTPVSFSTPDYTEELKNRRTKNANPYDGMPGLR